MKLLLLLVVALVCFDSCWSATCWVKTGPINCDLLPPEQRTPREIPDYCLDPSLLEAVGTPTYALNPIWPLVCAAGCETDMDFMEAPYRKFKDFKCGRAEGYDECKADIAFLLDGSGSVQEFNWQLMLDFVVGFAKNLNLGMFHNHMAVADFGNYGDIQLPLIHRDIAAFEAAVKNIRFKSENTNTASGLRALQRIFSQKEESRRDVPIIAIILTDGKATQETDMTLAEAKKLKDAGVHLFGIGIGRELDISELERIIEDKSRVIKIDDFVGLQNVMSTLLASTCESAQVNPVDPLPHGWDACKGRDVALVLDASGSIDEAGFGRVKQFAKKFINRMTFGPLNTELSIVVYSTYSWVKLSLPESALKSKGEIEAMIDGLQYIGGRTNISGAVRTLYSDVFPHSRLFGELPALRRVAVLVTDAESNIEHDKLAEEMLKAKKDHGISFFVAAVERKVSQEIVARVASMPLYDHVRMYQDLQNLENGADRLFDMVCSPQTYSVPNLLMKPEYVPHMEGDIVFVLDSTWGAGEKLFEDQKMLVKYIVGNLTLSNAKFSVLAMGSGRINIRFSDYNNMENMEYWLDNLRYSTSSYNLASGLNDVHDAFLDRGARSGVPKMIVLLTSGEDMSSESQALSRLENLKLEIPGLKVMVVGLKEKMSSYMSVWKQMVEQPASGYLLNLKEDVRMDLYSDLLSSWIYMSLAKPKWECSFEKVETQGMNPDGRPLQEARADDCGLIQDRSDGFDWTIIEGPTPSQETGPSGAYKGRFYAYIEATSQAPGSQATLYGSYHDDVYEGPMCALFWYSMYGYNTARLEFLGRSDSFDPYQTWWSMYGDQGPVWRLGMVELKKGRSTYEFGFRATRGEEFNGDIALDHVKLQYGPCPMAAQFSEEAERLKYKQDYY